MPTGEESVPERASDDELRRRITRLEILFAASLFPENDARYLEGALTRLQRDNGSEESYTALMQHLLKFSPRSTVNDHIRSLEERIAKLEKVHRPDPVADKRGAS